jgi:hypothetical protein
MSHEWRAEFRRTLPTSVLLCLCFMTLLGCSEAREDTAIVVTGAVTKDMVPGSESYNHALLEMNLVNASKNTWHDTYLKFTYIDSSGAPREFPEIFFGQWRPGEGKPFLRFRSAEKLTFKLRRQDRSYQFDLYDLPGPTVDDAIVPQVYRQ